MKVTWKTVLASVSIVVGSLLVVAGIMFFLRIHDFGVSAASGFPPGGRAPRSFFVAFSDKTRYL